jgi:endonuclease YncB( thermonuclease family)
MSAHRNPPCRFIMAALVTVMAVAGMPASAGDATYGTVIAAKNANTVVFKHDSGTYDVRVAGIVAPGNRADADKSRRFVTDMAVGQRAQFRLDGRNAQGVMVGKIYLDDASGKVRDLGIEMVRAGLAMPVREYRGYKYGELNAAMTEAKSKKAGVWETAPQR